MREVYSAEAGRQPSDTAAEGEGAAGAGGGPLRIHLIYTDKR